jgi:hypothetical protein
LFGVWKGRRESLNPNDTKKESLLMPKAAKKKAAKVAKKPVKKAKKKAKK